ncbi:hypothetical protein [Poseidonocella sp. HB161398]|uniref:hypothetical protein n=1 Tax=Poseidonocella sp. HB161398 TaxID=2320855 RepID=UPI001109E418|nr:hypothetical protein [Poseidonocella sp. HB161398]
MPNRLIRAAMLIAALPVLPGCTLDREAALREELSAWLALQDTLYFRSRSSCTAALFALETERVQFAGGLSRAGGTATGLALIERGVPVYFDLMAMSPSEISEGLMTRDLARGIGLLSSGLGPVLDCAGSGEEKARIIEMFVSTRTRLIYVPGGNALILVSRPDRVAAFLRGNV